MTVLKLWYYVLYPLGTGIRKCNSVQADKHKLNQPCPSSLLNAQGNSTAQESHLQTRKTETSTTETHSLCEGWLPPLSLEDFPLSKASPPNTLEHSPRSQHLHVGVDGSGRRKPKRSPADNIQNSSAKGAKPHSGSRLSQKHKSTLLQASGVLSWGAEPGERRGTAAASSLLHLKLGSREKLARQQLLTSELLKWDDTQAVITHWSVTKAELLTGDFMAAAEYLRWSLLCSLHAVCKGKWSCSCIWVVNDTFRSCSVCYIAWTYSEGRKQQQGNDPKCSSKQEFLL